MLLAAVLRAGHHHAPDYQTPGSVQQQCNPDEPGEDGGSCMCNAAGMGKANPWKGRAGWGLASWGVLEASSTEPVLLCKVL